VSFRVTSPDPTEEFDPLRVLILGDDELCREDILPIRLKEFGFHVMTASADAAMAAMVSGKMPDIVLLNIGLPGANGFGMVRRLRSDLPETGIVLVTGRSERIDHVRALTDGADAYFAKPVDIGVLVATLHSVLRRLRPIAVPALRRGQWRLYSDGWVMVSPTGASIKLNKTERCLMEALMRCADETVSRDTLIRVLWGNVSSSGTHRLESVIYRLRRKVLARAGESLPLDAVYGVGFVLSTV
jgi:DNA-binding response OmpR family regulator